MSTTDTRTTHTDALETLGMILGEGEARDAIHLAVEPVIAGCDMEPGDRVGFFDGDQSIAMPECGSVKALGIVDPFLKRAVAQGERFWLIVNPREITSLRHVWAHPAFPDPVDFTPLAVADATVASSKQWIENYVDRLNAGRYDEDDPSVTYDDLIGTAREHVADGWGGYLVKGGLLEGVSTEDAFWDHFEIVTGVVVPSSARGNFFSCSC
jgi:hypothetical protein